MAGTSDPLEDMLFSEVDEKAVSDLVGSLESQLVGQSNPADTQSENRGAGSTVPANHHLGKTLPVQVGTTLEQQQQHKAGMHQEINSKEISSEKTFYSVLRGSFHHFRDRGKRYHERFAITWNIIYHNTACIWWYSNLSACQQPQHHHQPRFRSGFRSDINRHCRSSKKTHNCIVTECIRGNTEFERYREERNIPPAAGTDALIKNVSTVSSSASAANSSRTVDVTSCVNTTNFTLSSSSICSTQSAIPLDKGTPTIALQRLPSHIVASIAQNGNGTTVSALVKQGAIGPITSAVTSQVNHKKEGSEAKSDAPVQSKIVMSSPSSVVNSVINSVSSPSAVFNLAATSTASHVMAKPAVNVGGQTLTTTVGMVRPASPAVATATQPLLQPGVPAAQRIVAPQLIVRPLQQQQTDDHSTASWVYHPTGNGVGAH
ncbi:unnamed protein product [Coregonus sp. 'balchen']|nr:unnamed protein product [Coregonus sp. 'balchen']